ncbi:triosephosphate isomerase (TIM) [Flexibacter flexilis DSM 6793]|uniref:Triosephosphate isomerase n=1 Tax=Flexibacter flexilis DSM 6793 TaxID=927664 RepID=A0A1I1MER1_9BACT|nr:triose-phosphate isomerase [Flexibacter flexilis]SFC83302.1 triosephosphate isomerase (TIM) [Flexibacter flexilis DSM 6793]
MRQKIVAGNWKMNKDLERGLELVSEVVNMVKDEVTSSVTVVLCPPFVHLTSVNKLIAGQSNIKLGAQNCHQKASGAYTGEVSAEMLKSVGTEYVILGHSERREYFQESNEQLAEKVNISLANGLLPIFCCGESLDLRQNGDFVGFVTNQLTESLFHLSAEDFGKIVIAYEPIWAIGTGLTATAQQAQDMHAAIRKHLAGKYGQAVADATPILYGGSAKPSNAVELFSCPDVDGGLIGGASLASRDFTDVVKAI